MDVVRTRLILVHGSRVSGVQWAAHRRWLEPEFEVLTPDLPGHGGRLENPQRMVRAYLVHRRWREQAILEAIRAGHRTIRTIVPIVYRDLDPRLSTAAALSVQAHVEHLIERRLVESPGLPLSPDRPLYAA